MAEQQAEQGVSVGRLLILIALALGIVLPLRAYVAEPITIASGSMEPTLRTGEHYLLDKVTLRTRALRRGDIIIFRCPVGDHLQMGKRVIGLPGDTVELKEKTVYVNGEKLNDAYAEHKRRDERLDGDNLGPLTVPKEQLFVLGDNRDESDDSTVWRDEKGEREPFVPIRDVAGLVRGFGVE
jgi:signal peptidase I